MIYKNILLLILSLLLSPIYAWTPSEYTIFTTLQYEVAADSIAKIHSEYVHVDNRLETEIVYLDSGEFTWYDTDKDSLAYYIRDEIINHVNDIKYLLLLGDEVSIPPIYITATDEPSDDFYSCVDDITELDDFIPQMSTGRIPVSDANTAEAVAGKLYNYMVNPTWGNWRSEIGLIADDENNSNSNFNTELYHTIYSNDIYENISENLNVTQFYGINYEAIDNGTSIRKPQMTADIIDYINQGVSLINYIAFLLFL